GIDRSQNQFNFSDKIRIDDSRCEDIVTVRLCIVASVGRAQTIDCRVDGVQTQPLNRVELRTKDADAKTRQHLQKVEHVVSNGGKGAYAILDQHFTDGSR